MAFMLGSSLYKDGHGFCQILQATMIGGVHRHYDGSAHEFVHCCSMEFTSQLMAQLCSRVEAC